MEVKNAMERDEWTREVLTVLSLTVRTIRTLLMVVNIFISAAHLYSSRLTPIHTQQRDIFLFCPLAHRIQMRLDLTRNEMRDRELCKKSISHEEKGDEIRPPKSFSCLN